MTATAVVTEARRRLGRVGVWINTVGYGPSPAKTERREIARIERLGYGSVWTGEGPGTKEAFAHHGLYLAATQRLVVGTGIANLWVRHGVTMQAGAATLAEAHPGRFILGVGAGHAFQAEQLGHGYKPLPQMRDYLDQMDGAVDGPLLPATPFPRVLAAIGPKMLELARDRADGAQPFFITVEHTAFARDILGPDKLLLPQHSVLLETDPVRARFQLREPTRRILTVPAYAANLRRLGYSENDIATVSDRLIDATHAWGDEAAIATRIREHLDAGADHILITPVATDLPAAVDQLDKLAPVLLAI